MDLQPTLSLALEPARQGVYLPGALLVMLIAGLLGGWVNRLLAERRFEVSADAPGSLRRYLVFGVVIAFVVPPLLLAVLGSPLLDRTRFDPASWIVFAALCLGAVLVVQRLFDNAALSASNRKKLDRLEDELDNLKQTQEALYRALEPVLANLAEPDLSVDALTHDDLELLRTLAADTYVCGNLAALAGKTGLARELISQRLGALKQFGLLETRIHEGVLLWTLSARGRKTLAANVEAVA